MPSVIAAAIGAVVVLGSLFGFQVLADKVFVTRREFEQFKETMGAQINSLKESIEHRFSRVETALDNIQNLLRK